MSIPEEAKTRTRPGAKRGPPFRRGDRVVYRVTGRSATVLEVRRARTAFTGWRVVAALDHGGRSSADAAVYRPLAGQ